jgi:methylglutaconyl-CoA hydratase
VSDDRLLAELSDGVLTLTLNRPAKRNALDSVLIESLHRELDRAELEPGVRVLLLRGAGEDFCAGADLTELLASVDRSPEQNLADAQRLGDVFVKARRLPKVVVAAVHGRALAGGCGLASACDLVVAHEAATFGYPEVKRGFVPAMVMAMLRRAVGEKVAFDLVATGRVLTAEEALGVGLASRVLPADGFEEGVATILSDLARCSGTALALIKRQIYEIEGRDFEDAVSLGARINAVARAIPDFKKAVAQFLEK